jgi:hypothetical protein
MKNEENGGFRQNEAEKSRSEKMPFVKEFRVPIQVDLAGVVLTPTSPMEPSAF